MWRRRSRAETAQRLQRRGRRVPFPLLEVLWKTAYANALTRGGIACRADCSLLLQQGAPGGRRAAGAPRPLRKPLAAEAGRLRRRGGRGVKTQCSGRSRLLNSWRHRLLSRLPAFAAAESPWGRTGRLAHQGRCGSRLRLKPADWHCGAGGGEATHAAGVAGCTPLPEPLGAVGRA